MSDMIVVRAKPEQVHEALAAILTPAELATLSIQGRDRAKDDFGANPRGEQMLLETIITFTAHAVTGGVLYDLLKKAAVSLKEKFGKDKVDGGP